MEERKSKFVPLWAMESQEEQCKYIIKPIAWENCRSKVWAPSLSRISQILKARNPLEENPQY